MKHLRRDTRGTTIVEYAIMLFLVLVVCAVGFKVLGMMVERKVGQANEHMQGQGEQANAQSGQSSGESTSGASAGAASGGKATATNTSENLNKDPTSTASTTGGGGDGESSGGFPLMAKFALIALGVIGAAAAFVAIAKGKPAGG